MNNPSRMFVNCPVTGSSISKQIYDWLQSNDVSRADWTWVVDDLSQAKEVFNQTVIPNIAKVNIIISMDMNKVPEETSALFVLKFGNKVWYD